MTITRRALQATGLAAGIVGGFAATAPDSALGREARRLTDRVARELRYAGATLPGIAYRLTGRRPDPDVSDDILADRVRSTLGRLEHRLDIPRVHVMVDDHVALLHGDVPDACAAATLEHATLRVSGVRGVESYLHIGLIAGDTRPSQSRVLTVPSQALQSLLDAAAAAGASHPRSAVHAVLRGVFDRIPADERDDVLAHLPDDVRALAEPVVRQGKTARVKHLSQLVAAIVADGGVPVADAEAITTSVITPLRALVPEEVADVAAVLPAELRDVWTGASPQPRAAR